MPEETSNVLSFSAKGRIPCRPLSYENASLALPKEIVVDYENGVIYICQEDGTLIDIGQAIKEAIMEDPDFAQDISVELPDGTVISLETMVINTTNDLNELKDALGYTKDPVTGEITFSLLDQFAKKDEHGEWIITINPTNIITDTTHQFVTETQINEWNKSTHSETIVTTIPTTGWVEGGTTAPYKLELTVNSITGDDQPIIDIYLSGKSYEESKSLLSAWANIFRIMTDNKKLIIYATSIPELSIPIQVKVERK